MRDLLAFPDESRVWIYQADMPLPADAIPALNARIEDFAKEWTSHNKALHATGGLLHEMFLILVADESHAGASGCSIDTSVRFIRQLGELYGVDFFDRLHFAYLDEEEIRKLHRDEIHDAYERGIINDETLFFDNLVNTKGAFVTKWVSPLKETWIKRFA